MIGRKPAADGMIQCRMFFFSLEKGAWTQTTLMFEKRRLSLALISSNRIRGAHPCLSVCSVYLLYRRREEVIEVHVGTGREVRILVTSTMTFNVYVVAYSLSLSPIFPNEAVSYAKHTETLTNNATAAAQT